MATAGDLRPAQSRPSSRRLRSTSSRLMLVIVLNLPVRSLDSRAQQRPIARATRHRRRSYRASADDAGTSSGTGQQSRSPSRSAFASSVAVGLGMRTPAAGPATSSQYSDSRRPRERLATLTRIVHWPGVLEVGNGRRASPDHSELIAPGGADDAEDVLVYLADEAGFEWCTSHICRSRAVRSWPSLNRRPRERRRRVVTSSDR